MRSCRHLIVGGGVAGAFAARTLAEAGADGVVLATRELDPPYHRPPITKGLLTGAQTKEDARVPLPEGVEVLTRTGITGVDLAARTATAPGGEIAFERLLVATGAMVRRLPLDGSDLDGIHYLRAPGNAAALLRDLEGIEEVVLVGGSYIGCEVAASLTTLGRRCTVVMQEDEPLAHHFGADAGRRLRAVLEDHGVTVRGGVHVERFLPAGEGSDRVGGVLLAGGEEVRGGAVVCGVGAVPDVLVARKAGLPVGALGGVSCRADLRVDGVEGVWAAGDVCEYPSEVHGRTLRIEHEDHAMQQGVHAARGMLGEDPGPYRVVPWFWSDWADWTSLQSVGPAADWAREEVEEDARGFGVRYLDADGRLVQYLGVGGSRSRAVRAARKEIEEGASPAG